MTNTTLWLNDFLFNSVIVLVNKVLICVLLLLPWSLLLACCCAPAALGNDCSLRDEEVWREAYTLIQRQSKNMKRK